ncbi:hypothetical protein Lalb_Chr03g0035811 [Lupinus albus]|uniref:Uncharacterized protein n=1 Tax=Lupinus albus TaxID=3870 RepID=A0A6A4QUF9_LUPAL|nr:hypothetical protein Lalb_Chr03g0035811 [Lupinus albus]
MKRTHRPSRLSVFKIAELLGGGAALGGDPASGTVALWAAWRVCAS